MAQRRGERMKRRLVIVGNPGCRRVAFWQAAAARRGWPTAKVVTYADVLTGQTRLADHLGPGALVRLESAAENWDVFKLLLKHGLPAAGQEGYPVLDGPDIERLEYERGWLITPRQCYLGFTRLAHTLTGEVEASEAAALNHGAEIAVCCDKSRCQERLGQAGVSIPVSFGPARDYGEVRARHRGAERIMVKLAHGSGAAGGVALHWSRGRVRALTTMVELSVHGQRRLYCSKRIHALIDELEIAALVDRLCVERVQVEEWLPKARWEGRNFDLRLVTIAGVARHALVRTSASPFTNLTLGNRRGDLAAIIERMGPAAWQLLRDTCKCVAGAFPRSFTLGVDVLVRPDFQRHAVLEVNAFGELLLNQLDAGEDTYTATLAAWERVDEPEPRCEVAS
jgi:hypothetical protein